MGIISFVVKEFLDHNFSVFDTDLQEGEDGVQK